MKTSKRFGGCLYVQETDANGVPTGPITELGNAAPLVITVEIKEDVEKSALCNSYGQNLTVQRSVENQSAELTLIGYGAEEIAWALNGTITDNTSASATVASTAVTAPSKVGVWVPAIDGSDAVIDFLDTFVLTDAAKAVTYVEGKDYLINKVAGIWTILATGSITPGDSLKWSGSTLAKNGKRIEIGTALTRYLRLFGSLKDAQTGDTAKIDLYQTTFTAANGWTSIVMPDENKPALDFTITMLTPYGKSSPGIVDNMPV